MAATGPSNPERLPDLLSGILMVRGLSKPDGRPLYGYRLKADEIARLRARLRATVAQFGGDSLEFQWCAPAFVAVACDWIRRWEAGIPWEYAPLLQQELGLRYSADITWQQVSVSIRGGLNWWGRDLHRGHGGSQEYLISLISEAGLPLGAVTQGNWLARWLTEALDLCGRGFVAEDAVRQERWRAPETLRETLHAAAVLLVGQIDEIRRVLPKAEARGGLDAIAWLDVSLQGWRDNLALDISDRAARELIENVVRAVDRGATADLAVRRGLRRDQNGSWLFILSLFLDAEFKASALGPGLASRLEGRVRVRLKPGEDLAAHTPTDLAVLEAFSDEEGVAWWRARPLTRAATIAFPGGATAGLLIDLGGGDLEPLALAGCDALTTEPLTLSLPEGTAESLELIGNGSYRTRGSRLAIAVPGDSSANLEGEGLTQIGRVPELDLELFEIHNGWARLQWDGQTYSWKTAAERDSAATLEVTGPFARDAAGGVRANGAKLMFREDGLVRQLGHGQAFWRAAHGDRPWRAFPDPACKGDVVFSAVNAGSVVARVRASIAPDGFEVRGRVEGRTKRLDIVGMAGANVTADGVPVTKIGDGISLDRTSSQNAWIELRAAWPDDAAWNVRIPDRTTRAGFADSRGRPLPQHWLGAVDALSRVAATGPAPGRISLRLRSEPHRSVVRAVPARFPLYAASPDLRAILGSAPDLDARVCVEWIGAGDKLIDIGLYDLRLEVEDGRVRLGRDCISALVGEGAERITLAASPLADPKCEEILHDSRPDYSRGFYELPETPGGPWLVYGRVDERFRFRPVVATRRAPDCKGATPLMARILDGPPADRLDDLVTLLERNDLADAEVDEVRDTIANLQPRLPLAALDIARALVRTPAAAVRLLMTCRERDIDAIMALEKELPFLWAATPVAAWQAAIDHRKSRMGHLLAALPADDRGRLVKDDASAHLSSVIARAPNLALHAIACGASPPADLHCDPVAEAAACFTRNDGTTWPTGLGVAAALGGGAPHHVTNMLSFAHDVLSAPWVCARIAAGKLDATAVLTSSVRWARLFDPHYFDRVLPAVLLSSFGAS